MINGTLGSKSRQLLSVALKAPFFSKPDSTVKKLSRSIEFVFNGICLAWMMLVYFGVLALQHK
jgi:hypothetical protein